MEALFSCPCHLLYIFINQNGLTELFLGKLRFRPTWCRILESGELLVVGFWLRGSWCVHSQRCRRNTVLPRPVPAPPNRSTETPAPTAKPQPGLTARPGKEQITIENSLHGFALAIRICPWIMHRAPLGSAQISPFLTRGVSAGASCCLSQLCPVLTVSRVEAWLAWSWVRP